MTRCDECGSRFAAGSSRMAALCPECAHRLYGYAACAHVFIDGCCVKCSWDGAVSTYLSARRDAGAGKTDDAFAIDKAGARAQSRPMEIATQLALFLENKPGTLAAVCDALAKANINIYALTVSDTVDHSVVRMVVSDTVRAQAIFEEHGTLVVDNEVLIVEMNNQPGRLSDIARKLSAADVNIEYAYLAAAAGEPTGLMVLRPSNVTRALEVLGGGGKTD